MHIFHVTLVRTKCRGEAGRRREGVKANLMLGEAKECGETSAFIAQSITNARRRATLPLSGYNAKGIDMNPIHLRFDYSRGKNAERNELQVNENISILERKREHPLSSCPRVLGRRHI